MRFRWHNTWDWGVGNMLDIGMGAPRALVCAWPLFRFSRAHSTGVKCEVIEVADGLVKYVYCISQFKFKIEDWKLRFQSGLDLSMRRPK